MNLVYHLSSEEHAPRTLVERARRAEQQGFSGASISDHFHPWLPQQGHSPFVWSVLGGIAEATDELRLMTAVTCPTIRVHPAQVAHAAATTALLFEGRFTLGVGTGEHLNEHVHGDRWPRPGERLDRLEEAIEVIRVLWTGDDVTHRGAYYTVEDARLYSRPDQPPPIAMAASGPRATAIASQRCDGLIGLSPDPEQVATFTDGEDDDRPRYGKLDVCVAPSVDEAQQTVLAWWGNAGAGPAAAELRTPEQFAGLVDHIDPEAILGDVVVGSDPGVYRERIEQYRDAGYDHVVLHQIGPDQDSFLDFAADHLL